MTILHDFNGTDGFGPEADLLQSSDGDFYGTTFSGGDFDKGTIFRLGADGSFTTLHNFAGGDGANPRSALIQALDGDFYGTTSTGGASGAEPCSASVRAAA